jgi:hypothetical protein
MQDEARLQNVHVQLQFAQNARVKFSFRESPVAKMDRPPVSTAPAALPPLIPFFNSTARANTRPTT